MCLGWQDVRLDMPFEVEQYEYKRRVTGPIDVGNKVVLHILDFGDRWSRMEDDTQHVGSTQRHVMVTRRYSGNGDVAFLDRPGRYRRRPPPRAS